MKSLIIIIFSFFLLVSTLSSKEIKQVSLQLPWKHQFEFAGFYIAKEKGYFKEVGLEIELKEFDSKVDITNDVESGKTTFGVNYPNIIYEKANGKDVVILNAILQSSPHVLMSLESSGLKSVEDFRGKTIMSSHDALISAPFISMLKKHKLGFEDLTQIPHTFNIHDIIEAKADIVSVFTSNELFELRQLGVEYTIWDPRDYGFDFYDGILFTSGKQLKKDPLMVADFNEASLKGWKYAFDNIEETVDIVLEKYNTQKKSREALLYEAKVLKELAYYKTDTLGEIDPNKIQRIYDIYNLLGYTQNSVDLDEFIFHKNNIALTNEEKKFLHSLSQIKVFAINNNEPLSYIENNNSTGYANELLKLVANNLGLKIKWVHNMSYSEALDKLKDGKIDLKSVYSHFRTSRDFVIPSKPIITAPFTVVGRFDSDSIKTISDLKEKKIVLVKGYQQTLTIEQDFPDIKFKKVDNIDEAYSLVRSMEADYYIDQAIHSSYYIREKLLSDLKIVAELPKSEIGELNLHFGVSSKMPLLHSSIEKALNAIDSKEIFALKEKWLISDRETQLQLSKKEKDYLESKKSIRMCIDPNWMPFEKYDTQGNHIGMSNDYFELFENMLDTKIQRVKTDTWSQTLSYAKERKCDIISLAMQTPERKEYLNFTSAYLTSPFVMVTKPHIQFIDTIKDLRSKKIGITKGHAIVEILKIKYPFLNLIEVNNIDEGLKQVKHNQIDVFIDTLASTGYALQLEYQGELKIAGKLNEELKLGIAVRDDDPILFAILQKAVNNLDTDQKRAILNKWISVKYEQSLNYTYLWITIGIFTFIAIIFAYRQHILKQTNKTLKRQQDELRTIFYGSKDPIAILDLESNFLDFNDEYLKLVGYSKDELLNTSCVALSVSEDVEKAKVVMQKTIEEGYVKNFEKSCYKKDGSIVTINMTLSLMPDKKRVLISTKDVTQINEKNRILLEQSKMAALGEMIGNIAHQWRQPLSVIATGATGLKIEKEYGTLTDERFVSTCDAINENAQYLSKTIDDFRNFIKGDRQKHKFILKECIDSFMNLLQGTIKNNNIELVLDIDETIVIEGYENELIQCLINIVNNAKDALQDSSVDKRYIFITTLKNENVVMIKIKDNANGIPEDIISHIFEPYFTTKHKSHGTGLGLHMTYNLIVEGMRGFVAADNVTYEYENKKYTGAQFTITLPLT